MSEDHSLKSLNQGQGTDCDQERAQGSVFKRQWVSDKCTKIYNMIKNETAGFRADLNLDENWTIYEIF